RVPDNRLMRFGCLSIEAKVIAAWFVPPRDTTALANAMAAATANPDQTRHAGRNAFEMRKSAKVSHRDCQQQYLEAYEVA
ncbi:MAG: hypothetical protein AAGJ70_05705, partial [Pseudomonadota bacterium]